MSNYTANKYVKDSNTPWYKIIQFIDKNSTVLDIGCSSGNLGNVIKQETNSAVVGVEIDVEDAKRAEKVLDKVYTVNLEAEDIPADLKGQRFDYIIFVDVIEHFVTPVDTLKKIKDLLKPSGKVLFSIPNMAHMSVRLMLLDGKFTYGETGLLDKTHLHFYDKEEVCRVFEDSGYEIETFDWVSRDYPRELLETELRKLGLQATDDFLTRKNTIEAGAYQFVGAAVVAPEQRKPKPAIPVSPDVRAFETYVLNLTDQKNNEIKSVVDEKEEYRRKLLETEEYARGLKSQLDTIAESKAYKLARKMSTVKNILTRWPASIKHKIRS